MLGPLVTEKVPFPPAGLGGDGDKSEGTKAVRAMKAMAMHHIELAVLDEAAAIDK